MKKYTLITILLMMLFVTPSISTYGEEKEEALNLAPDAKSAILIERDTGEILFDKNAHQKLSPASMTKIMTLLLVMEAIDKGNLTLNEMIRVSERASSMGGSQVFLEAGEEMSVEDLLKAIAIASGNDASVALAERLAGSEEAFVKMMNDKAKELNLENTKFQNSSGLPADDHYSTSYDIAVISKELLKYETITDYTSIYEDYLRKGEENEFWLVNTNKLVRFYSGVDGLKTGYTNEAKYCLAATAKRDDMRVIAVVMGSDTVKERNATISQMLDYAFNHFETKKLFDKGDTITSIRLLKAENKNIPIVASESVSTLYKKGESIDDITQMVELNETFDLPLQIGDQVGTLTVKQGDEMLSETPLTVDQQVNEATYFTLLKRAMQSLAKHE
ncbi:MAG TPA: D-alanyl-D-alanine carboxypeptidase family protein [Virgibacillus sp.]|nr:D-alanyl-D-alanine carboxypeptidase family protein [Virgibacillus sp.]